MVLRGVDDLAIDLDTADAEGCVDADIDGEALEICLDQDMSSVREEE